MCLGRRLVGACGPAAHGPDSHGSKRAPRVLPGEQPHGRTLLADDQPVAVMLDLVHPVPTCGRLVLLDRLGGHYKPGREVAR
jgi:hypothetical protein